MMFPTPIVLFAGFLAFFHFSEFALALIFMRDELSIHSWLISKPYAIAMSTAVVEYALEVLIMRDLKVGSGHMGLISWTGVALVVLGEVIRKTGMLTAQANFTHNIRIERNPRHTLVTGGIYRYIRHPGYLGWFIWCLGTQVLLANPVSLLIFATVAWRFFQSRIQFEEYYLRRFFGHDYVLYAARTPTWIPFIP